ncbi:TonB-dependent receptor plug domain-containing protein [Chitinophaga sedimenti]|uniref:TonB-dependent receptor plug domain-containing protein n=1 Tax=Chitinophaga sedimenti TaxID=2033606 RepID=UPI002003CD0B|nr:TonB-dependent receptor plug domain-containing protein [Chitinophaga sedimenti]MCK7559457.1 TonB-dependent receptor plug domain-containing protein [Chitinophaga sedimenti]
MKLSLFLILLATLQASAFDADAQNITANYKNATMKQVLDELRDKTGTDVFYRNEFIAGAKPVTITFNNTPLETVLARLSEGQPFVIRKIDAGIILEMRRGPDLLADTEVPPATVTISGYIRTEDGKAIKGATVRVVGSRTQATTSNDDGYFTISGVEEKSWVVISSIGYEPYRFSASGNINDMNIRLKVRVSDLQTIEVKANTGFQELSLNRVNGSVVTVDNQLFNRRVTPDIISRLNGVIPGAYFNPSATGSGSKYGITIRGQNTLSPFVSRDPLIIVDNFPFEGDLGSLNPNDVENVTVLMDAAAAALWGARAGNGVIVITTKRGRFNQKASISFNSNVTIGNKPDVTYDQKFVDGATYIGLEKVLFDNGYYNNNLANKINYPSISPAVEIMNKVKTGQLTQQQGTDLLTALGKNDIRDDYTKYFLRKSVVQQYALNVTGGGPSMSYYFSVGYDQARENSVGNRNNRISVMSSNTYSPVKNLLLTASLQFSQANTTNNNPFTLGNMPAVNGRPYSYGDLVGPDGSALALVRDHRTPLLTA